MFYLPRALLKIIRPINFEIEMIIPTSKRICEEDNPTYIENMITAAIEEIYNRKTEIPRHIMHRILMAFGEAFTNACDHGNFNIAKKKIVINCWFGKNGIVFSFCDEGDFFRQTKTKKIVEARIPIPTARKGKIPGGDGMGYIYKADEILVSTRKNALYLLFKVDLVDNTSKSLAEKQ